jgi:SAM-dependent methyltransferase
MLLSEAQWISNYFARNDNKTLGTVLNIGSSTADFRERKQSFIGEQIFRPLARRGVPVIHSDVKAADGVDIVADIMNDLDLERLRNVQAKTILCSNMLEHVPSAPQMAERLASLVPPGGVLLVTVPNSYPYHPDPIDTLLRPDAKQLGSLFGQLTMLDERIVEGPTACEEMIKAPSLLLRRIARSFIPFSRFDIWLSTLDRWRWLFRHYRATCVVLRKPLLPEAERPITAGA